jgi:hypothetical protein
MPIELSEIPDPLKHAARCGNLIPFIGAGISRLAKSQLKNPFPTWTEMIRELSTLATAQKLISSDEKEEIDGLIKQGKYLMAAEALRESVRDDFFEDLMHKRFGDPNAEPGLIHDRLFDLKPSLILTTNYDKLLEKAYYNKFNKIPEVKTFRQAHDVEKFMRKHERWVDHPLIFKIHGSVDEARDAVFAEKSYRELRYRAQGYRAVLGAIFVTRVVLMLGFSFSDPEIAALMETLRESLDHRSSIDYIVLPKGEKGSVEKRRLKEDFGLQTIEYERQSDDSHPELLELIDRLSALIPPHAHGSAAHA